MHHLWTAVLGVIATLWITQSVRLTRGMAQLPRLASVPPLPHTECPTVSVIVAARDEAAKLPQALPTQLNQDYPRYEVIAVDDRSQDATAQILEQFRERHKNFRVIHIHALPAGWLGKPHALSLGYREAPGEWLVFTDADVQFAPDLLRRALALAKQYQWDHLTALPLTEAVGFWEKVAISYFVLIFTLAFEPWRVSDPRSSRYLGVGAFQLIRRSTYEAIGTHERLAMEIADDTKLGKLVKQAGFRSGVARAQDMIRVRWQEGWGNLVRGISKNLFSACGFRLRGVASTLLRIFAFSVLPFIALLFTPGTARWVAIAAAFAAVLSHAWATRELRISPLYALMHPLGAVVFCYLFVRSTILALWRGGVVWRETFYPLEELRRGMV